MKEKMEAADVAMNNAPQEGLDGVQVKGPDADATAEGRKIGLGDVHADPHLDPLTNGIIAYIKARRQELGKKPMEEQKLQQVDKIVKDLKLRGVDVKALNESGDLYRMMEGQKTAQMYKFTFTGKDGNIITQEGKLSLLKNDDGSMYVYTTPKKRMVGNSLEEHLKQEVCFGHQFTPDQIRNLALTGNAGEPIMLDKTAGTSPDGMKPHLVSIDKDTLQIYAVPCDKVHKFKKFLDVELTEAQTEQLVSGKPLRLNYTANVTDKATGEVRQEQKTGYLQYNAAELKLNVLPQMLFVPKKIQGIDLTEDQRKILAKGEAIQMTLTDNKGQKFNAFVSIKSDGKRSIKDGMGKDVQLKANDSRIQIKPTQEYKEQVNLNNKGIKSDAVQRAGKEVLLSGEKVKEQKPQQKLNNPQQKINKPKPKQTIGKPKLKGMGL